MVEYPRLPLPFRVVDPFLHLISVVKSIAFWLRKLARTLPTIDSFRADVEICRHLSTGHPLGGDNFRHQVSYPFQCRLELKNMLTQRGNSIVINHGFYLDGSNRHPHNARTSITTLCWGFDGAPFLKVAQTGRKGRVKTEVRQAPVAAGAFFIGVTSYQRPSVNEIADRARLLYVREESHKTCADVACLACWPA